jgi:hypothetical protein
MGTNLDETIHRRLLGCTSPSYSGSPCIPTTLTICLKTQSPQGLGEFDLPDQVRHPVPGMQFLQMCHLSSNRGKEQWPFPSLVFCYLIQSSRLDMAYQAVILLGNLLYMRRVISDTHFKASAEHLLIF